MTATNVTSAHLTHTIYLFSDTATPVPTNNNDVHKWQILTTVLGLICLIVAVVALAGFSWKKRKDAQNGEEIFILETLETYICGFDMP